MHSIVSISSWALPLAVGEGDSSSVTLLITGVVAAIVGAGILHVINLLRGKDAKTQSKLLLEQSKLEAGNLIKQAELTTKEKTLEMQAKFEAEVQKQREELRKKESAVSRREESLQQAAEDLRKQEKLVESTQRKLADRLENANRKNEDLGKLLTQQQSELQKISGLSKEDASKQLMSVLERDLQAEMGTVILKHQRRINEIAEQKSQEILLTTMQRFASTYTAESTTSTVDIPNDDMKGRIIGREGRNIRAFEKATGIDIIIDDTPGVVIVSGFDPVRREIARQSLDKLIADGRIHPTRIEEIVAATEKEIEQFIRKRDWKQRKKRTLADCTNESSRCWGRLHFRTSYSQNVLRHSVEVSFLSGMIAEMIGLDPNLAKRCGLLHDIGKAADHELEGGHPKIGADILKRHGEGPEVVHAALGHHDQLFTEYPYTLLVATADACSASRPGARRESLERYIKRMEELESIARAFPGVEQAFAIQAGRELRVIASSKETDDAAAAKICRDIARAFEQQLTYPGEIKVTVVRESRFMEVAR